MDPDRPAQSHDAGQGPSASAILIVLLLLIAGTTRMWGSFTWEGLTLLVAATALALWIQGRPGAFSRLPTEKVLTALLIGLAVAICCTSNAQDQTKLKYIVEPMPGIRIAKWRLDGYGIALRLLGSATLVVAAGYLLRLRERVRRHVFGTLVAMAIAARILILFSSPSPVIDVLVSQTTGAKGLLLAMTPEDQRAATREAYATSPGENRTLEASRNVYAMEFPSPYFRGRTFDHYGYPPATVYVNALSWWAFKDVRGAWLICDLIAALCIYSLARRMNPGPEHRRFCELVALAFLFLPRAVFVLEQSWTEPLVMASLGVLAVLLARPAGPIARGLAMGVFFSSKQYVVLAVPHLLKLRKARPVVWVVAAATGILIALPFALWNWDALYRDVFGFFLESAGRPDALSIYGAFKRFGHEMPWWLVTPLWFGGVAFFTWKMKRTLSGMLFSLAGSWLFFFMLGKQAFMNYWHVIMFTLLLAIAASPQAPRQGPSAASVKR